jgi:type I restriction enzyme M protein
VTQGGGKAAVILSGSPLFNGDAGSGPSNIRRWLFQEDLIDCIVKLPTDIFFRTGIATYVWILSNKKAENRHGMVQLVDASKKRTSMRKNLGNKRFELSDADIEEIVRIYVDGYDHGISVMVPATDFMFRQVTTQRPLRMAIDYDGMRDKEMFASSKPMSKLDASRRKCITDMLASHSGESMPYSWASDAAKVALHNMDKPKPTKDQIVKAIVSAYGMRDASLDAATDEKGETIWDSDLKDTENVPWGEDVGEYMAREVLPYAPDTVVDETATDEGTLGDHGTGIVGTSISFNRYFYRYEMPRDPKEIASEIMDLEDGLDEFVKGFLS